MMFALYNILTSEDYRDSRTHQWRLSLGPTTPVSTNKSQTTSPRPMSTSTTHSSSGITSNPPNTLSPKQVDIRSIYAREDMERKIMQTPRDAVHNQITHTESERVAKTAMRSLERQLEEAPEERDTLPDAPHVQDEIGQRSDRKDHASNRFPSDAVRSLEGPRTNPFRRRGRKWELPLRLNNDVVVALADTGSDVNVITEELAEALKVRVDPQDEYCAAITIGDGQKVQPCGRVEIFCSFLQGLQAWVQQTFFVFQKLAPEVYVIMGRTFLEETKTLTTHRNRLRERTSNVTGTVRVLKMQLQLKMPKTRMACYLDGVLALACADTGSEIDLMSRAYAMERGFHIESVPDDRRYVMLATTKMASLSGMVKVRFDTFQPVDVSRYHGSTDCRHGDSSTADNDEEMLDVESEQRIRYISIPDHNRTFYVLDDLNCDVLLGEELLDSIDAFPTHGNSFFEIPDSLPETSSLALNYIKWASKLERRCYDMVSRVTGARLQTTDPPPSRSFCE